MSPLTKTTKDSYILTEFSYGSSSLKLIRFTDWTENVPSPTGINPAGTFYSMPTMEVVLPKRTGTFEEEPILIKFKKSSSVFLDRISNGEPHPKVTIKIWEINKDSSGNENIITHFIGRLTKAILNPNDEEEGSIHIEGKTTKENLEFSILEIVATHQCAWHLGGKGCGITVPFDIYTVTGISNIILTVNTVPTRPDRFYHRGFVERDGLRIDIRDWRNGQSFELRRQPPQDWLNQSVSIFGGCDQLLDTCKFTWGNEENFVGVGIAMPAYNPNFELSE